MSCRLLTHEGTYAVTIPSRRVLIPIDDALIAATPKQLVDAYREKLGHSKLPVVGVLPKKMPAEKRLVIERAYLAALRASDIPQEIKELFWVIHGRAIA